MEKRFVLAFVLIFLVLTTWSRYLSKSQPIKHQYVTQKESIPLPLPPSPVLPVQAESPGLSPLKFQTKFAEFFFSEENASITEVVFSEYHAAKFKLHEGFFIPNEKLKFKKTRQSEDRIEFIAQDNGKEFVKVFNFKLDNSSVIELDIFVREMSSLPQNFALPLVLGTLDFQSDPNEARYLDVTVANPERVLRMNGRKDTTIEQANWTGMRNRYFCAIIEPEEKQFSARIQKINSGLSRVILEGKNLSLAPAQVLEYKFHIYLGPQELKIIKSINPKWSEMVYFGTFNLIGQLLVQVLEFFYRLLHNWGWVIVGLSVLIYIALFPLSLKQMRSMKEMQMLQPRIEELRRMYKDNPQRLNKETMELYREHKVNPFGGCLPMILQIPVFFSLYQVLMRSVALKGAKFLWIKDLSEPDRLFLFPRALPIIGNEFNILPIIMAIGMFVQQKLSMRTTPASSSASAEQQKLMLVLFPIMFGMIFYKMPAALVLYWFINSTLMLVYQWRMSRKK